MFFQISAFTSFIFRSRCISSFATYQGGFSLEPLDEMALPNGQQVSLRDALEVVPLFDRSNIPLSHFIEGCYEAKAMLPTPSAQDN